VTAEYDRKLEALRRAELREFRNATIGDLHTKLTQTVAKCDELVSRLREPSSNTVVDLPAWPRRGRDVN
jgi:hypothetical protein